MENNEEFTQNSTLEEANSDAEEASCVMEQSDAQTLQETPSETAQETSTETAQPRRKKSSKLNTALNVALWVLLALLVVALVLRLFVFGSITIRGESMTAGFYTDPNTAEYNVDLTFHEFDVVTVNKVAAPKRGDVVVFYKFHVDSKFLAMFGHGEDVERDGKYEKLIKRVVALGGDKLWVERQTNGKYRLVVQTPEGKFYEDYYVKDGETLDVRAFEIPITSGLGLGCLDGTDEQNPYVVKENCFFALGDNRGDSEDSRGKLGDVPLDQMYGVVI